MGRGKKQLNLSLKFVKHEEVTTSGAGEEKERYYYVDEANGIHVKVLNFGSRSEIYFRLDGDNTWYKDGLEFRKVWEEKHK